MSTKSANAGWRDYWRENRLAACAPDKPSAAAAIEEHWTAFFKGIETESRILDIATGNGVLLLWATHAAKIRHAKFHLSGIDAADIDPLRYLPEHRSAMSDANFVGNTSAEALPFKEHSFDLVVSQYGLEYAALNPALDEIERVLRPGGQLHCLSHCEDSAVVAQGYSQLKELDLLLNTDGPFTAMQQFLEAQRRGRKIARATEALTEVLRRCEQFCIDHPNAKLAPQLCGAILDTANSIEKYRPDDVQHWLKDNLKKLRGQRQRITDLQAASLNAERLSLLEQRLHKEPWLPASISALKGKSDAAPLGLIVDAYKR